MAAEPFTGGNNPGSAYVIASLGRGFFRREMYDSLQAKADGRPPWAAEDAVQKEMGTFFGLASVTNGRDQPFWAECHAYQI